MTLRLSDRERLDWLRLFRTENVGPITFYRLLERFGNAGQALDALPSLSKKGGARTILDAYPKSLAEAEIEHTYKIGARLIAKGEADYPKMLANIDDAPPIIAVLGNINLLNKPSLGIVGARNASLAGQKIASHFAADASRSGYCVVSGLARGIDTAAHQASLTGGTVAVVAGGIDIVYPPENQKLYDRLKTEGAIIAESPFGTEPIARHFPKRNRIVSGMSLGVLVIEAAARSGSLITAKCAAEQGREVFAVPGSPLDPRSEGSNILIRDGAHLAQSPVDVISVLDGLRQRPLFDPANDFDHSGMTPLLPSTEGAESEIVRAKILTLLSPTPAAIDDLIRSTGASAPVVLTLLLELELAGRILRHSGNRASLNLSFEETPDNVANNTRHR